MHKYLVLLALSLFFVVCAQRTPGQTPAFTGSFEVADCNTISGWAFDANNQNTTVHVNFFVGSTIVATALANGPRKDVGAHGFNIPTPLALKDQQVRTISARVESSNNDILNSPRSMGPCGAPANLTVLVVRTNSTVISGAAVCVASGSDPVRSGFTDSSGHATFNAISQGQVTITVAGAGFTGQSHTSTLGAGGGTALFRLSEGSGGPVCNAVPPPTPPGPATLAVTSFDWHVNRRTPLFFENFLTFAATKTPGGPVLPSHYRVGESSDLSNTPWIAYPGGVIVFQLGYRGNSLTAYGPRTVHFQIKKDDITSPVVSKTVDLQPVSISEFRLQGTNLFEMLTFAEGQGFAIRTRNVSVTENVCSGELSFRRNTLDFLGDSGNVKDRDWVKVMEITLVDSPARRFTAGWRVKSIEVSQSSDFPGTQTISGAADANGFKVTIRLTVPRKPGAPTICLAGIFALKAIVLAGPADDMALDQTKRWKNMFPSN